MKNLIIILSVLLATAYTAAAQQLDSLTRAGLSAKLDEYLTAIETAGADAQIKEADFLIEASTDSLIRQFTAIKVYEHYITSPVMGADAVAIHVFDKWFESGKVSMYDDIDLLNARVYADFNRQSLIGKRAPSLELKTMEGGSEVLFPEGEYPDKSAVLYFYDTDCSKCKLESIMLNAAFAEKDYPVDFHAVYTGDNPEKWKEYAGRNFNFASMTVRHYWDPELDSDFQRKYGVLQTPRMFLIAPDGTILGRALDTDALIQLVESLTDGRDLEYGGQESVELFDYLLGNVESTFDVTFTAAIIESSTLMKGNVVMYRQLMGDYLYYLASKPGRFYREGLAEHIEKNIFGRPEVWTSDDHVKVIGFAEIMHDLLSKSKPGTRVADIKVQGELIRGDRSVLKKKNLRSLRKSMNYIIFHTESCNVCAAEVAAARKLAQESDDVQFFLINVDEMMVSSPALANRLFDLFDLSTLPYIVLTDKKGVIMSRYETLLD